MKKRVLKIIIIIITLLVPVALLLVGFCAPAQFDETYYGELGYMYDRLKSADGKKIVLIGNSSLAFGIRTDLMEKEFPDYEIVNFGLYGAIGTKAMLDLSRANIGEGDIVIVLPERDNQSQSLYFSADKLWMAVDGNFSMLTNLKSENTGAMAGNYFSFLSQKYGYLTAGNKPSVSGVYMQASFDDESGNEVGYMTYDRPYNTMSGGYDVNNLVDFSETISQAFIDYLNEYNLFVKSKGANLYYGFTPVNRLGLSDDTDTEIIDGYYDYLIKALDFRVLGKPDSYLMDYEWFYDSNFHLNSAGMYVYTDRLVEDIKAELGISTCNSIVLPEKPQRAPAQSEDGDNTDAACFTYEDFDDGVRITGLTEEGKGKSSYIIPATYGGKPVRCFAENVFAGNTAVTQITVQENLQLLYNASFEGCTRLTRLIIRHGNPSTLGVGINLLLGADNCKIYVKNEVYDLFATHYNWGAYRNVLLRY